MAADQIGYYVLLMAGALLALEMYFVHKHGAAHGYDPYNTEDTDEDTW